MVCSAEQKIDEMGDGEVEEKDRKRRGLRVIEDRGVKGLNKEEVMGIEDDDREKVSICQRLRY